MVISLKDFDRILAIMNNFKEFFTDEDGPAVLCTCDDGKGRSTTAMAIAGLIYCNKKVGTLGWLTRTTQA